MYLLLQFAKKADENNVPMKRYSEIKEIINYNYMDCQVVYDIIVYMKAKMV